MERLRYIYLDIHVRGEYVGVEYRAGRIELNGASQVDLARSLTAAMSHRPSVALHTFFLCTEWNFQLIFGRGTDVSQL
jgi:hypothetical protein